MGIRALRTQDLPNEPDRDVARLLVLLEDGHTRLVTITDLRDRGIEAPAQAIYTLQLMGYQIDRVAIRGPNGRTTTGYRLGSRLSPLSGASTRQAGDDEL